MVRRLALALFVPALLGLSACSQRDIELSEKDPLYNSAVLFQQRCAGCHTLEAAGSEGSSTRANSRERKDGPNFNERLEDYPSVLYAIRNGGFSSGPMPQNIVVGKEAQLMACFVSKYSGKNRSGSANPSQDPTGASPGSPAAAGRSATETGAICPK